MGPPDPNRERLARLVGDLRIGKIRIGAEEPQCFAELGLTVESDEGPRNERHLSGDVHDMRARLVS